ncbi:regulatory protein RecX [Ferrimonas sediminicola]|uniref:Regulatory protein RecX n=2 Tax=Ferrimonas sediminicola TaxID=2569538 RepID=A0A4V5NX19_9GAMM|nr:regulatory protein RecX [Ferrimonas sediminicola]TKB49204.1 regulatory protein RecX [Ferrimonas sediminicola]
MQKLRQRGFDLSGSEELFLQLEQWGYLDESRFAHAYARSRAVRGQGPAKVRQELRQRGVPPALISAALGQEEVDWWEGCLELTRRRFDGTQLADYGARQKARRFLMGRGFDRDQIEYAFEELSRGE